MIELIIKMQNKASIAIYFGKIASVWRSLSLICLGDLPSSLLGEKRNTPAAIKNENQKAEDHTAPVKNGKRTKKIFNLVSAVDKINCFAK
ncbi:MAG: hypothetical protein Pars2KO_22090 [Parasphingorhabdus sp.]